MCECVPPPPLFDLPPPPDPSLIWRELALPSPRANVTDTQLDAEVHAFERFFHEPAGSCAWLERYGASDALDAPPGDSFWATNFGGDKNVNRLYYLLSALFLVLFMACCAAIVALRSRSTNKRLKSSQRSTPSLNSSKLSTETVGTATATMVASVGSSGRGGGGVATFLNNNLNNISNNNNNNNNRLPQMYHSATISRRNFAPPPSNYCMQYPQFHPQQQHIPYSCQNNCQSSCCGCQAKSNCCYDEQQRRIYSSQSATNIFGNICLAPSPRQQQQQQQIHHIKCMNNGGQLPNFVHPQQPYFINNTVARPRCAALRVQNQPPQMSLLLPQGVTPPFLQAGNCNAGASWSPQTQRSGGYSSATQYDYEEIANPAGAAAARQFAGDETDNTTVFEDLSENLRQMEQRQSQRDRQHYRQPPPMGRPPPVPMKRQITCDAHRRDAQEPSDTATYQMPPSQTTERAMNSPGSSIDVELEHIEERALSYCNNNSGTPQQQQGGQPRDELAHSDSGADRTCDDATSLANSSSADANEGDYVGATGSAAPATRLREMNDECRPGACGRESGYGTGKSRRLTTNSTEISPPMQFAFRSSVPDQNGYLAVPSGQLLDAGTSQFKEDSNYGTSATDPPPYPHISPTMTYV